MTTRRSLFLLLAGICALGVACSDDSESSSGTTEQPFISTGVAQCNDDEIAAALPEGTTLDSYECAEGWAAITFADADGTEHTEAYQAEGQFWIAMPCDAEGIPDSISDLAC